MLTEAVCLALTNYAPGALAVLTAPIPQTPALKAEWIEAGRLALYGYRVRLLGTAQAAGREYLNDDEDRAVAALDDFITRDEEITMTTETASGDAVLVPRVTAGPTPIDLARAQVARLQVRMIDLRRRVARGPYMTEPEEEESPLHERTYAPRAHGLDGAAGRWSGGQKLKSSPRAWSSAALIHPAFCH